MRIRSLVPLLSLMSAFGCAGADSAATAEDTSDSTAIALLRPEGVEGSVGASTPELLPARGQLRVLFLGTSLTEGLGLDRPDLEAWPIRLAMLADSEGVPFLPINAGLSGETSAGALRRLDWVLRDPLDLLIIETGANDGLRAIPVDELERNLDALLLRARELWPNLTLALVQMEAPPNLGVDYADAFRAVYPRVAARHGATLLPRFLDEVAGIPALNQADGIHPTAAGHEILAQNIWGDLEGTLRERISSAP